MNALTTGLLTLSVLGAEPGWKRVDTEDGITLEAREVKDSAYLELKGTVSVPLPVDALCAGAFGTSKKDPKEPSLQSRKVISESENERVTYDTIAAPVVSDRDYAVRTVRQKAEDGSCRVLIDSVPELAPPVASGLVRVEKLRCRWTFEPQPDGKTALTYTVWTDPNTPLPTFLVEPSRKKLVFTWVKLIIERAASAR